MSRYLVASPVRQSPQKLRACLTSLAELESDGFEIGFAFIDDNTDPQARRILREFSVQHDAFLSEAEGEQPVYATDEVTHHWKPLLYHRVATFKDQLIELTRSEGYDGIFLVDSDLVLHPQTLRQLVSTGELICSEVFWTRWRSDGPEFPQVWVRDQYTLFPHHRHEVLDPDEATRRQQAFLDQLRIPGVYEVGGLGACTLIRREAIERGVRFQEIDNLSVTGEDRDFCVRARALGISLHVDTHFPALHIYRSSDLDRIDAFRRQCATTPAAMPKSASGPTAADPAAIHATTPFRHIHSVKRKATGNRVTLSMLVHNEAGRYLREVLTHAASYVDEAVIVDDASTDDSVAICRDVLRDLPHTIISTSKPLFAAESRLRQRQWEWTLATDPDWVLCLDADERFEDSIRDSIHTLVDQTETDVIAFRLYDMWSETEYRDDHWWRAHTVYRPFMIRASAMPSTSWSDVPVHAGRVPPSVVELQWRLSNVRLQHLGWARPEDRIAKHERYRTVDPHGVYGSLAQYESILDPNPSLHPWNP